MKIGVHVCEGCGAVYDTIGPYLDCRESHPAQSECDHPWCKPFDTCEITTPECNGQGGCPHVMQPRCTWCKREQWMLAVYPISHGLRGCTWCRTVPKVYTDVNEYRADLEREPWIPSGT